MAVKCDTGEPTPADATATAGGTQSFWIEPINQHEGTVLRRALRISSSPGMPCSDNEQTMRWNHVEFAPRWFRANVGRVTWTGAPKA
jgi:hypothetical protein